jgi:tetratricopeptide (TPR) repeat protein
LDIFAGKWNIVRCTGSALFLAGLFTYGCGTSAPPAAPGAHDHGGPPATLAGWARGARLFEHLGTFHRPVTTSSAEAQQYFDQGMRLLWAFNHDESTRSFAQAAVLDPACALCYWGVALTVGPNYNVPVMAEPRAKVAWEALQQARKNAPKASPVEQALIAALAKRYQGPQPLDPSNAGPVMVNYANEMRDVAKRFPDDLDVQVLFAEARMTTNSWKLWTVDGKPAIGTPEIQATLEGVLAKSPTHPGANHYYIHTMEASPHPDRALASAERLRGMMPDAGHLQHMPAHIMQRVGRYADASEANRDGVTADLAYITATPPLDYYPMYLAHNYQFLAYSAAMEGRKAEALEAATKMRDVMPAEMLLQMAGTDWYVSEIYSVMIRFGQWDAILAEPAPDARLQALTAAYHYSRAVALSAKGRVDDAKAALGEFDKVSAAMPADAGAGLNVAKDVLAVASLVAQGEIARAAGKTDDAIARLTEAIAKEDRLAYDEPADWFVPVRHQLGAVLLSAGKAREAEAVYREDLLRHPRNGWALFGLAQALRAQHKTTEATSVDREFAGAWKKADVRLTKSVF